MEEKSEVIYYKDIAFRRYPNSSKWADRNYYVPNATHRKRGIGRLHQEIWKDAHGLIPEGYHIHHKDENPLNNSLENLECLSIKDHNAYHVSTYTEGELAERREWFNRIRPAASNWHGSEEGRAWHKELGHMAWNNVEYLTGICENCGEVFQYPTLGNKKLYCSNKCKSASRRKSGVDNEQRICAICGSTFTVDKYSRTHCCSRTCAQRLRRS